MAAPTPASFTAPFTWTSDLAITVARLNNMIGTGPAGTGGNLNYILDQASYAFNGKSANYVSYSAGNFTLGPSSASYTAVSASLQMTLACNTGRVMGYWMLPTVSSDNTLHVSYTGFTTIVDGAVPGGSGITGINQNNGNTAAVTSLCVPITVTGISAGNHTFALGWANDGSASVQSRIWTSSGFQYATGFIVEY